jgi:hypothetical protein
MYHHLVILSPYLYNHCFCLLLSSRRFFLVSLLFVAFLFSRERRSPGGFTRGMDNGHGHGHVRIRNGVMEDTALGLLSAF